MDVLFLTGSAELGGAERCVLDILASVREARPSWRLHVLTPADGPLLEEARALDVAAEAVPLGPALARLGEPATGVFGVLPFATKLAGAAAPMTSYARRLRSRIRDIAPHIVHTHGLKAHLLAAWLTPTPSHVIWHLHDYIGRRRATTIALRRSLRGCTAMVANSVSVADDARAALSDTVKVSTVLNAVDLVRYAPEGPREDLDALAGTQPPARGTLRVGLVATFGRWKGHRTFIEACARLDTQKVHAYVIGAPLYSTDGSQYTLDELKAHAARLGIADRVTFTGYVRDSDRAIRALDIVVHASTDPEPFGLVIAEAMACGRAVIVADAGGAREIVRPGVDALTHAPGDASSLANRMAQLANDVDLRGRLCRSAREAAVQRFDRRRLAPELIPIYESALAGGANA